MLDFAIDTIREYKRTTVASAVDGDPGDIEPAVYFERAGELVAVVLASQVDRDEGLRIVQFGIPGFAADSIIWVADCHYSHSLTNPMTGKPWAPNEMQHACDKEGACDLGLIQDTLMLLQISRSGAASKYVNLPYDVDKDKKTVHWHGQLGSDDTAGVLAGLIPDTITAAFELPVLRIKMIAEGLLPLGLPEYQQASVDQVVAGVMATAGFAAMLRRDSLVSA